MQVLEYGIPQNQRMTSDPLEATMKIAVEACGADYAMCWSSTVQGTTLATTSVYLKPSFLMALCEKEVENQFYDEWISAKLDATKNGPVSNCMQSGEPSLIADVGESSMKRSVMAPRYGVHSVAFFPAGGDVIELGKAGKSGWVTLPRARGRELLGDFPVAQIQHAFNDLGAAHAIMWAPQGTKV